MNEISEYCKTKDQFSDSNIWGNQNKLGVNCEEGECKDQFADSNIWGNQNKLGVNCEEGEGKDQFADSNMLGKLKEVEEGSFSGAGVTQEKGDQKKALYTLKDFMSDNEGIHFYTGLETYQKCMLVFSTLCPEAYHLNYWEKTVLKVPVEDQFFLTLMKLRRNTRDYELGRFFGCCKRSVSNIFLTWVHFLSEMWSMLDWWPSRDLVDYFMPAGFRKEYPSTRVIVDGTEIPIEAPGKPKAQQASFSHYKNRTTLKVLVGATPAGLISFCSKAYGGSAGDRALVEKSELLSKCEEGDSIMADRGFVMHDLCASKGVKVNMPTFMKSKTQLPSATVLKDRKLANKGVHIEREINLIKTYTILAEDLDRAYIPIASDIVGVSVMLCNFRRSVINKDAQDAIHGKLGSCSLN